MESLLKSNLTKTVFDILFPFGRFLREIESRRKLPAILDLILRVLPVTFFVHWIFSFIPFGGLFYLLGITLINAFIHIIEKNITTQLEKINIILWYLVIVTAGFGGLWGFLGHFFLSNTVAYSVGWEAGSPFQIELAFYHLGISVAALLAIWYRSNLVAGIAIIRSIFLLGAFYVHLKDMLVNSNYSPGNTGAILIGDLVLPLVFIFLLVLKYKYEGSRN